MKGKGGGDIKIVHSKARKTQDINDRIVSLRSALFTPSGADKDVTSSIPAFMKFQRNGLDVVIEFRFKLSKDEMNWAFDTIKSNMEEIYNDSGFGWDDEDKEMELNEEGKRFLLVKDTQTGKYVGLVHFRFTVQGN